MDASTMLTLYQSAVMTDVSTVISVLAHGDQVESAPSGKVRIVPLNVKLQPFLTRR